MRSTGCVITWQSFSTDWAQNIGQTVFRLSLAVAVSGCEHRVCSPAHLTDVRSPADTIPGFHTSLSNLLLLETSVSLLMLLHLPFPLLFLQWACRVLEGGLSALALCEVCLHGSRWAWLRVPHGSAGVLPCVCADHRLRRAYLYQAPQECMRNECNLGHHSRMFPWHFLEKHGCCVNCMGEELALGTDTSLVLPWVWSYTYDSGK